LASYFTAAAASAAARASDMTPNFTLGEWLMVWMPSRVYPDIEELDEYWPWPVARPRPPVLACDAMVMACADLAAAATAAAVKPTSAARRDSLASAFATTAKRALGAGAWALATTRAGATAADCVRANIFLFEWFLRSSLEVFVVLDRGI